jgi:tRNA (cytidine56-2'-O)-methyltransferase
MITILRIGHRPERDKRITTHVGLVARAFNADQILIDTGDSELEQTITGVSGRFGGKFKVMTGVNWRDTVRNWDGIIIHLSMFGEQVDEIIEKIRNTPETNLLIIVGSTKVPREVFELADYNVAIGHQPHSEVAALAIFLDRYFQGSELKKNFNGLITVLDSKNGKNVIDTSNKKTD